MTETPLAKALDLAQTAFNEDSSHAQQAVFVLSWIEFLRHVNQDRPDISETEGYREAFNRGRDSVQTPMIDSLVNDITAAVQLLPMIEELEVRATFAKALGHELTVTVEDPDPGRDWSRVRGELFKPSGKWAYSVRLDYSKMRHRGIRGEGPHGWHFDGSAAARGALAEATAQGTSGVTMSEIPNGWRLFVPNPPQGYPTYVIGGVPDDRPDSDTLETIARNGQAKLDEIHALKARHDHGEIQFDSFLDAIQGVLDR